MSTAPSYIPVTAAVAVDAETPFLAEAVELREPGPHELLVKVVATGICHTDVMTKAKGLCEFPIVLGHEGVGVVEEVGEGVACLLYTSPSPRDRQKSRMPSSA